MRPSKEHNSCLFLFLKGKEIEKFPGNNFQENLMRYTKIQTENLMKFRR
jgi:hypothetical protein